MLKKDKSVVLKKTNQFNNLKPLFDKKHVLINDNNTETEKTINLFQKKLKTMTSINTKNTTSENNNSSNIIVRPQINFIGLLDELNKIELSKKKKEKFKLLKNSKSVGSMVKEPILKFNLYTDFSDKIPKQHKKFIKRKNITVYHNLIDSKFRIEHLNNNKSVSEFIIKTNNIAKEKYEIELKKERLANLIDIKENNLNLVKSRIKAIKETKDLFENKFLDNFNEYIKHLNILIKNEQKELMEIEERKKNVKNDLHYLEIKIYEKQRELTHLHNWFLFFIEVKEKKRNININMEFIDRFKQKLIFNTPEDFLESINFLSKSNLRLLHIYNNIRDKIYKLELYRESWFKENLKLNDFIIKEFENKEKLLKELKKNNILLNNEKKYYQILINKSRKSWLVNLYSKISHKIVNLHQNIIEQNKKLHYISIINDEEKITNLGMLYNIEKLIDEILNRINKLNIGKNGELVKNALIKLRINKAHNEKIELERKRIEEMNKRNIEKANKIYFIPHRKIDKYYSRNIINKLKRNKSKENNIKNKKFYTLKSLKTSKSLYDIKNFEHKINSEIIY